MEEKRALIYDAICKILTDINAIEKSRSNSQQGYKYRGIDDYYNTLHDLFSRHGVFTVSRIIDSNNETIKKTTSKGDQYVFFDRVTIAYTFYAKDGSFVTTEVVGAGLDYSDKSVYKALAGAHKYALQQIFMVPTDENKDAEVDDIQIVTQKEDETELRLNKERELITALKKQMAKSGLFTKDELDSIQNDAINMSNLRDYKGMENLRIDWENVLKEQTSTQAG